ncbi:DUF1566 domain-containing protein [Agitococcus lubricus]|uniref:Uncharacterized protein DUF1566 n=1 Tax=Agitococcus lubricus TaxID=1077255 RepID=A0A2T5J0W1_9GAMM|nr:DUF1566 domain-containing protein [Agitococcus lubricus]PTQ90003.1 uncharacterized protein DUF1566 [Agitococcus lubricus]
MNKCRHVYPIATLMIGLLNSPSLFAACFANIISDTPNSRYQIQANPQEVKDLKTGLIWQRCSLGQTWNGLTCEGEALTYTWQEALKAASEFGRGYQLPNIKELRSLVNKACINPAINSLLFPNTASFPYWTSTPVQFEPTYSWSVVFGAPFLPESSAGETSGSLKSDKYHVRLLKVSDELAR